jgi:hypothetical protein
MKTKSEIYYLVSALLAILTCCKHPYQTPATLANNNFLVVNGFINAGTDASTTINLTRTQNLADTGRAVAELNASITLESSGGASYSLQSQGNGDYMAGHLNLNTTETYRVKIATSNGSNYVSDFVPVKQTPPIDSLSWKQDKDVSIYVSTHDPANSTLYYRWEYTETWNYQAAVTDIWDVNNGLIFLQDSTNQSDSCWRTDNSTNIVLSSSVALSKDVISEFPVAVIPQNDEKISDRYSILVRQYALTPEAYQFHLTLQKNTQQLGNLFDPQPSQLIGNIHCLTNPNEPVIGFVSASSAQEKRIFIRNREVKDWHYITPTVACSVTLIGQSPIDFKIWTYPDTTYGPYYFVSGGGLYIIKKACYRCTEWGGSNQKPAFW